MTVVEKSENFSTCRGISDFSTQQMWRNGKFWQNWMNFTFLHMTDMKFTLFCGDFYEIRFGAIYALLRGKKLSQKLQISSMVDCEAFDNMYLHNSMISLSLDNFSYL